ncbi:unnamed protein product, partial [Oppiella nova]
TLLTGSECDVRRRGVASIQSVLCFLFLCIQAFIQSVVHLVVNCCTELTADSKTLFNPNTFYRFSDESEVAEEENAKTETEAKEDEGEIQIDGHLRHRRLDTSDHR